MVISVRKKTCFLCQHVFQPFFKMRKFLLDIRKKFPIMSHCYLLQILSELNRLTIVTSKKNTCNEHLCAHFDYFIS